MFKKFFSIILCLLIIPLSGSFVYGEEIKVFFNGVTIAFDQAPILEHDRTLVPMRAIFETMGASVEWNEATQTVTATKKNIKIVLTIGSDTAYKNEQPIKLDIPAKTKNDRTFVPLRFVSEAMGCQVVWEGETNSIFISSKVRIAIASDLHFGGNTFEFCGLTSDERMQLFLKTLHAEHEKQPFQFLIITGDIVECSGSLEKAKANFEEFRNTYAPQFQMPVYYVRGNHDRLSEEDWETITGQPLEYTLETDDFYFIAFDTFPNYKENKVVPLDEQDYSYIESELEKAGDRLVYIVSHYFDKSDERFTSFIQSQPKVNGFIYGHSHVWNTSWDKKNLYMTTGSFYDPTHTYPTKEEILAGKNKNLFGFRVLESDNGKLMTYQVQPELYYPYYDLHYPATIQNNIAIANQFYPSIEESDPVLTPRNQK